MPFVKKPNGKYRTPNGAEMTAKQVKAYYATEGFNKPYRGKKKTPKG
jgi:hypothetical protein